MATFEDVVRLTADLPLVEVGSWYGTPGVLVKGKGFCRMWQDATYGRDGIERDGEKGTEVLVLLAADIEEKHALLSTFGPVLFETPHYEGHAGYLVRLTDIDLELLGELLEDSYRCKAPKKVLRELDEQAG